MKPVLFLFFILFVILSYLSSNPEYLSSKPKSAGTGSYISAQAGAHENSVHAKISARFLDDEKRILVDQIISVKGKIAVGDSIPFIFGNGSYNLNAAKFVDSLYYNGKKLHTEFIDSPRFFLRVPEEEKNKEIITLKFSFIINLPVYQKGLGYSEGREFILLSGWFPRVASYNSTNIGSYLPANPIYSRFDCELKTPENFYSSGNCALLKMKEGDGEILYHFSGSAIDDCVLFITGEIEHAEEEIELTDGRSIKLNIYLQPEKRYYLERYFEILSRSMKFLDSALGRYPYDSITLLDPPRALHADEMIFTKFFLINAPLLSTESMLDPELDIAYACAKQYFGQVAKNRSERFLWISNGIPQYLASVICRNYYPKGRQHFRIAKYIPLQGLNFLSYNEIPIIYSLGTYNFTEATESYGKYYNHLQEGALSSPVNLYKDDLSAEVLSRYKSNLMLLSIEKVIGEKKLISALSDIFRYHCFRDVSSGEVLAEISDEFEGGSKAFLHDMFYETKYFDYAVSGVKPVGENKWEVTAERLGDAVAPVDIAFYTETDTQYAVWTGKERWRRFYFLSEGDVIAAEADPYRKIQMDINFANNSYTYHSRYWASISIAIRWFFWVQNALMIMGSSG